MYFQAAILAALSAGALADQLYLTAFAEADYNCTGTAAGNNVTVPITSQAHHASKCTTYAPGHGQNIQFDRPFSNVDTYTLFAFNDTDCHYAIFALPLNNLSDGCIPMNNGPTPDRIPGRPLADWKTVRIINYGD